MQKNIDKDKRLRQFTIKQITEVFGSVAGGRRKYSRECGEFDDSVVRNIVDEAGDVLVDEEVGVGGRQSGVEEVLLGGRECDKRCEGGSVSDGAAYDADVLQRTEASALRPTRQFFSEFDSYFEPGDIEGFLGEVAYLKRGSEEVALQELASMVRDDVEHFAK
eukprot:CAMPEP_0202961714 /NCGR_PEP_ID=MMETSP1396-20130829/5788_1 /ASSEMBLY_ACC=CAM_ASM_000872 /TAXON_ID= /ORGANISM="Pseudokeronopsis sp., Strain Brazil" /LENGTH=162 /DNA_ID=CAMNT_0049681755 /DNA_START=1177 /DNA_END=1668 /DNA_ORIENTATION=-